jgi:haloacid dehalogenase-like hydrolase
MIDPIFQDTSIPWAIDMDGTLIREDVTLLAIRKSFMNPLLWHTFLYALFLHLFQSMTHAHRYLETRFPPNPKLLTYNRDLMRHITDHRQRGGHVILATASHYQAATPVAKHVDLFDDVVGSNPPTVWDAAAAVKAQLLMERFPQGFLYAGNSNDDIIVWESDGCKAMVLVNCPPKVLDVAQKIRKPYIVIP